MLEFWHIQHHQSPLNRERGTLPELYAALLAWPSIHLASSHYCVITISMSTLPSVLLFNYIYLLLARCSRTFISNAVLPVHFSKRKKHPDFNLITFICSTLCCTTGLVFGLASKKTPRLVACWSSGTSSTTSPHSTGRGVLCQNSMLHYWPRIQYHRRHG